ncbi:DELTA-actitoxin-Afr1a-like isoform X2 [Trematomus bernacchii]|uniref:DELTA-actitoxin-Afr1a-like isoform X2 n=1 Tax=Trematomus bernacchii TaxID=40690 RepID=UPI00146D76B8|nr:DELTA-actitoxin-Afr1a-like isoform X2 [Trematomus bernacchii]
MFFIKQQQSASCTQLLITHQTRPCLSRVGKKQRSKPRTNSIMEATAAVKAAGAVFGAGENVSDRTCSIEIVNECGYTFDNPRMYTFSGYCATPLPPTVAPGACGIGLFTKSPSKNAGSVGVFAYDLNKDGKQAAEKIAIMFSVPWDFNKYKNWYALGVFDVSTPCDEALYNQMYYDEQITFRRRIPDGSCLTYVGDHITIMATMSDAYQPVIKVRVSHN